MIKRINHIKDFGVFKDYQRIGDVQDFAKLNIIYGWNYSGKTTISRIFQSFENKQIDSYYHGCDFQIEDYDGRSFSQSDINTEELQFKVFNSDFIKDNIHLEGEAFDPILIVGKDSKEAIDQIAKKKNLLNKYNKIISGSQSNSIEKQINKLDNELTNGLREVAGKIRTALQLGQSVYTVRHATDDYIPIIKSGHYKAKILSKDKLQEYTTWATKTESDKLSDIEKLNPEYQLNNHIDKAKDLLNSIPEFSKIIQYFVDNPEVADWVEKGFETINKGKNKCEYCGNKIDEERKQELIAHFSKDLKEHKKKLIVLKKEVIESKLSYPNLDKSTFYTELWNELDRVSVDLKKSIDNFNFEIDRLAELIQLKHDEPFKPITDFSSVNTDNTQVEIHKEYYNNLVAKHNKKTTEFTKNKHSAQNKIKAHFISKFILTFKPWEKDDLNTWLNWRKKLLSSKIPILKNNIEELESSISKAQVGAKQLNTYIEKFLGRKEVKVKVFKEGENEWFKLVRNDKEARHLSEGEKTAIAFSYFLTKLDESTDLVNTIVYIDDPISSLDSNHIFQVNALLKDYFLSRSVDDKYWELKCEQLFISTHNFDFFGLLRKDLHAPRFEFNGNMIKKKFYYYVKRLDHAKSTITQLPNSLKNYSSEYHYLFDVIYQFDKSNSDSKTESDMMGIPNAVRRFTELYTYSRLPGHFESSKVDDRASQLWGAEKSKRVLKVFHYFSHSNDITRMLTNSDLMCDIENAVSDLLKLIETSDKDHYDSLLKAVS